MIHTTTISCHEFVADGAGGMAGGDRFGQIDGTSAMRTEKIAALFVGPHTMGGTPDPAITTSTRLSMTCTSGHTERVWLIERIGTPMFGSATVLVVEAVSAMPRKVVTIIACVGLALFGAFLCTRCSGPRAGPDLCWLS